MEGTQTSSTNIMFTHKLKVVGTLSGTSVDGIDVVVVEISREQTFPFRYNLNQICFETIPFLKGDRERILDLCTGKKTVRDVCIENFKIGEIFASAILQVLKKNQVDILSIDLIGCHGQTIWHEVEENQVFGTLQIGEGSIIAERTGITTIADFRVRDVSAGGQGAPLTSTFDWLILRPEHGWCALQNIGGIGNVTFLPGSQEASHLLPLAFDTGPGNCLIDWSANQASNGELLFDINGEMASKGIVFQPLFELIKNHPYFDQLPPKTTGRELFTISLAKEWRDKGNQLHKNLFQNKELTDFDFVATLTELTAWSIAYSYKKFSPGKLDKVIISGGGSRNSFLMKRIEEQLKQQLGYFVLVQNHDNLGINSDAKEALLFALLAYNTCFGLTGNVKHCTGAKNDCILGKIIPGKNFHSILFKHIQT